MSKTTDAPFDVVLWGATGFAGALVAERLAAYAEHSSLRWAIAGRSEDKLQRLRDRLAKEWPSSASVPTIVADAADRSSLDRMVEQARVIITTVGPYATYGDDLVAACVDGGVDYCDLTGEVPWIRRMIDAHHERALSSGVRIVHCCGFDSIPSDIGTFLLQERAIQTLGSPLNDVVFNLMRAKGGFSGGTIASLLNVLDEARSNRDVLKVLRNPYGLNPEDAQDGPELPDRAEVRRETLVEGWSAPFVMAAINTRIVRRTNALLNFPYGRDLRYREVTHCGRGTRGRLRAEATRAGLGAFVAGVSVRPVRAALERFALPAPGEGPSRDLIERGFFDARIIGCAPGGETLSLDVHGDGDPGYGATAGMLAASGLCLAFDRDRCPDRAGVLTPAAAFGATLVDRLAPMGITFDASAAG